MKKEIIKITNKKSSLSVLSTKRQITKPHEHLIKDINIETLIQHYPLLIAILLLLNYYCSEPPRMKDDTLLMTF